MTTIITVIVSMYSRRDVSEFRENKWLLVIMVLFWCTF